MANTFLTTGVIANLALASLRDATVLGSLVYRDAEREFVGGSGSVVTIRKPASFVAKTFNRANGIEIQDISETSATITLDTILDVSTVVTAEQLTMNVIDLRAQVIQPAMDALADGVENALITRLSSLTGGVSGLRANPFDAFVDAHTRLSTNKVPAAGRVLVLDPVTAGNFLKSDKGSRADVRGDGGAALQDAALGSVAGFDIYVLNSLPANVSYAFHRDAFALVSRALALPAGGDAKGSETFEGNAIRWVYDYDVKYKQDVLSFDVLVGTSILDANRAVKITLTA